MRRSRSLSAKPVILERYEIQALIDWHRDEMFQLANKMEYADADDHKHRADELGEELKQEVGSTESK